MTRSSVDIKPTPRKSVALGAAPSRVTSVIAPQTYVMESADIRLKWGHGWGHGLQPTRLEFVSSGAGFDFAPFTLWRLEEQASLGDTNSLTTSADVDSSNVTVTQTSDTNWTITWVVNGLTVRYQVTISGDEITWTFTAPTNTSGKRFRSFYCPLVLVRPVGSLSDSTERLVDMIWAGGVKRKPEEIVGAADSNLDNIVALGSACPGGAHTVDMMTYYSRNSGYYFMMYARDEVGELKTWYKGYDSTVPATLIGLQHFPPGGSADNTWTAPYSVRWVLGSCTPLLEWWFSAKRFRTWCDSIRSIPDWYLDKGYLEDYWCSPKVKGAQISVAVQPVDPVDTISAAPTSTTAASDDSAGSLTITAAGPFTSAPAVGDHVKLPGQAGNGVLSKPVHKIRKVESSGDDDYTLTLDRALEFAISQGDAIEFVGPKRWYEDSGYMSALKTNMTEYAGYLGVTNDKVITGLWLWTGTSYVRSLESERSGWPFFEGQVPRVSALGDGLLSMHTSELMVQFYTNARIHSPSTRHTTLSLSNYEVLEDSNEVDEGGGVGGAGPCPFIDWYDDTTRSSQSNMICRTYWNNYASGVYLDAQANTAWRNYNASLSDANKGDSSLTTVSVRSLVDKIRERARFEDQAQLSDGDGNDLTVPETVALSDGEGGILTDGAGDVLLSSAEVELMDPETDHILFDGDDDQDIDDGDGNLLFDGTTGRYDPLGYTASELAVQHHVGIFDYTYQKYSLPFTADGITVMPEIWRAIFGPRQQISDLDTLPVARFRIALTGDLVLSNAELAFAVTCHEYHCGWIVGIANVGETQNMRYSAPKPSASLPNETLLNDAIKHLALWDGVAKVRTYRRWGELQQPVFGDGFFLENWERTGSVGTSANSHVMVSVWEHDRTHPNRLLVIVSNRDLDGAVSPSFMLRTSIYPSASGDKTVFELDQSGGEAEFMGPSGKNAIRFRDIALAAAETRIFEVR